MAWWQREYVRIVILVVICVAVLLLPAPTQAATSHKTLFVGHLLQGERYEYSYVHQDEITHHAFTFDAATGDVLTLAPQWLTAPPSAGGDRLLTPVVHVVLFHSPACKYSQTVINEILPPLKEEYGDQLQVLYIDISTTEGLALFQATGSTLAPNHVAFSSMSTPTLITGDMILVGSREIAEQLPGLISDGLAAGGVALPPVPGLWEAYQTAPGDDGAEIEVNASCEEIKIPPPAITSNDKVTVSWIWATTDASYLEPHREAVNYIIALDGVPLSYGDPVYDIVDAGDYTIHALTWYVDVGSLSAGTHRVDYFATWSTAISTGDEAYGPGTAHPTQVGGCTFEVTDGAGITASEETQQVDLASLEAVDYAAIAASIPPPVDPQRIQQTGDNGTGLPTSLTYAFEPEEIAPGVFVDTLVSWTLSETAIQPGLHWEFRNEGGSTGPVDFIADIPKEFASSVDEIAFSVPPTEIIEHDPVVRWLLEMDDALKQRIDANSIVLMSISDPENTLNLLEGFQNQLGWINLRRQFQSCQRASGTELDEEICALTVIRQNSQYFTLKTCDSLGIITDEGDRAMNVIIRNACRNLIQPYDNMHCDFEEAVYRDACLTLTRNVLTTSCEGLTDVDRNLCLYDVAAYVGDMRGCSIIEDADMVQDCRAQLSGDPAYCADITDPVRHEACCAIFQADAAQYAACMREQEPDSEVIIEGETLTLDEVLGTGDADVGGSAFGPLPTAPDLNYLMNDAFYAEYACEGETERIRFISSRGQLFYAGDDARSFPLVTNLAITMAEQDHNQFAMFSLLMLGSPGLWLPLDGSTYSLPAVMDVWATDAESYNRYTALDLRPFPDTLAVAGNTLDAVRYEGSYTAEVVNDNRDSTFVDGYYSSISTVTFRSRYDLRTGLLLQSYFQQQPVDCYREGDYADNECPAPIELVCTLVDTSVPIGR